MVKSSSPTSSLKHPCPVSRVFRPFFRHSAEVSHRFSTFFPQTAPSWRRRRRRPRPGHPKRCPPVVHQPPEPPDPRLRTPRTTSEAGSAARTPPKTAPRSPPFATNYQKSQKLLRASSDQGKVSSPLRSGRAAFIAAEVGTFISPARWPSRLPTHPEGMRVP